MPHELTIEQNIFLLKDFVREQFTRKGYAVDWAIHAPDPRGDNRNYHAHILVPLRKIDGESFGMKDRYTKQVLRQKVTGLRRSWATLANRHLKRYGHSAQIDERSLRAQGNRRKPTKHHGMRSKIRASALDGMRPSYPRSPVVRISKQQGTDGSVTIKAVIKHSALNAIGTTRKPYASPALATTRKGWPEAAIRDWETWGSKNVSRFFTIWKELAPTGFIAGGVSP